MNRVHQCLRSVLFLGIALAVPACSSTDSAAPTPPARPFVELGVPQSSSPLPGLHCSGQPTPEQFGELQAAGITNVICLRAPGEEGTGWEEARAAELGISFSRLVVEGGDQLTEAKARELDRQLASAKGPTLVCCGSSNRVGALMAMRARLVEGKSPEEALAIGKACGLSKLEPTVKTLLSR